MSKTSIRSTLAILVYVLLWATYATLELWPERKIPKADVSATPLITQYNAIQVATPLSKPAYTLEKRLATVHNVSQ